MFAELDVPSPQFTFTRCLSNCPTSVNRPVTVTVSPSSIGPLWSSVTSLSTGLTFAMLTTLDDDPNVSLSSLSATLTEIV